MSHLILKDSHLIPGFDYTENEELNKILENPRHYCVVLYPGKHAKNISALSGEDFATLVPKGKKLVVIVVDGTWNTAKQTMRLSANLSKLPQISFDIETPSNFRVRKQPQDKCLSTVEAIHKTIQLLGNSQGFDIQTKAHDNLIEVFQFMVTNQESFISHSRDHL